VLNLKFYSLLFIALVALPSLAFVPNEMQKNSSKKVIVGADTWQGYTNADGTGVYLELLYEIYGKENVSIQFDSYQRTRKAFENNQIDIMVGVFREDVNRAIFPNWHLDKESPLTAFYKTENITIDHIDDFSTLSASWRRGYGFEQFLPEVKNIYLINEVKDGFKMLMNNRIDAFIDYPYNLPEEYKSQLSSFQIMPIRPIYLAFAKNTYGKSLAKKYDERMPLLRASGKLKNIYQAGYKNSQLEEFNNNKKTFIIYTDELNLIREKPKTNVEISSTLSSTLNIVFEQLEQYRVEYKLLNNFTDYYDFANKENTCISDMIKTPEREEYFLFSKPISLYLGLHLYSTSPLNIDEPIKLKQLFTQYPNYKLGTVLGRSYGEALDIEIKKISKNNIVYTSAKVNEITKLLQHKRYDLIIDYPLDINFYWQQLSNKKLYSYPIEQASKYALGHLMCSNTASGRKLVADLNLALEKLYQNGTLYNIQFSFIAKEDRAVFNQYFQQEFKTH
jgi:uncharacterized protein (TIGR02285 family)